MVKKTSIDKLPRITVTLAEGFFCMMLILPWVGVGCHLALRGPVLKKRCNQFADAQKDEFDDDDERFQCPIDQFVQVAHAFADPVENRGQQVQELDPGVNNAQDDGAGRDDELLPGLKMHMEELGQQQLDADIEDDDVSGGGQNRLSFDHPGKTFFLDASYDRRYNHFHS